MRSKTGGKKSQFEDKESLLKIESDCSLSPEHRSPLHDGKETPLKVLQPSRQETQLWNKKENVVPASEIVLESDKISSGAMFAIIGAHTGESETDVIESNQSKRTSKINMIAESVFGVPTKQAVAEAQANVSC